MRLSLRSLGRYPLRRCRGSGEEWMLEEVGGWFVGFFKKKEK